MIDSEHVINYLSKVSIFTIWRILASFVKHKRKQSSTFFWIARKHRAFGMVFLIGWGYIWLFPNQFYNYTINLGYLLEEGEIVDGNIRCGMHHASVCGMLRTTVFLGCQFEGSHILEKIKNISWQWFLYKRKKKKTL